MICGKDEWGTPQGLFDELDKEFNFTLDPCGSLKRPLKKDIITNDYSAEDGEDGLAMSWEGHNVFVNPPYSGDNIKIWMYKCYQERTKAKVIVLLIPTTKTGTKYFKEYVLNVGAEIRFVTGRVNFVPLEGQKVTQNPLYSMLIVYRNTENN